MRHIILAHRILDQDEEELGNTNNLAVQKSNVESNGNRNTSDVITRNRSELVFDRTFNESKLYLDNVFENIAKIRSYEISDNSTNHINPNSAIKGHNSKKLSMSKFYDLKEAVIKEALCRIFKEAGYSKFSRCRNYTNFQYLKNNYTQQKLSNYPGSLLSRAKTKHLANEYPAIQYYNNNKRIISPPR